MGSNRPTTINQERGRRSYVEIDPVAYMDEMRRVTDFYKYSYVSPERHSEFKKPYLADNYQEMEYWYQPPFSWSPQFFDEDHTWFRSWQLAELEPAYLEDIEDAGWSRYCMVVCFGGLGCGDPLWCYPLVEQWFDWQIEAAGGLPTGAWWIEEGEGAWVKENKPRKGECLAYPPSDKNLLDSEGGIKLIVGHSDGVGNKCYHKRWAYCKCDDVTAPYWFSTPSTIGNNSSVVLTFAEGHFPALWDVVSHTNEDVGFTSDTYDKQMITYGRSVTLYTGPTGACGAIMIGMQDYCGTILYHTIRGTTGTWNSLGGAGVGGATRCNGTSYTYGSGACGGYRVQCVCARTYDPHLGGSYCGTGDSSKCGNNVQTCCFTFGTGCGGGTCAGCESASIQCYKC